jgi:broad specificity phosphatase PhoE
MAKLYLVRHGKSEWNALGKEILAANAEAGRV